jgi:hypothetical protein
MATVYSIRREIINFTPFCSIVLQSSQPLLRIIQLSNTWISVLPKGEEFLVGLYGFLVQAFFKLIAISLFGIILIKPSLKKYHEGWSEFS